MTSRDATEDPRRWSGPNDGRGEEERGASVEVATAAGPRIDIADALNRGWIEIWYQPKIDLKRKCLAGAEALARIHHPELGVLLPGTFLPEVNENSVTALIEYALVSALRDWSTFNDAGFNLHLAVNVPVTVLQRLPISELVQEHRPSAPNWPGLIVEVGEEQIVRNVEVSNEITQKLRASGITIAIDDFGAGYSAFSSLRELSFAELKLDRSFVAQCATNPTNAAICQTAIDLAHRFGSAAVGEAIDNSADLHALMMMGCDFGQGILIAPPMPKGRFLDLLHRRLNQPNSQSRARSADASAA